MVRYSCIWLGSEIGRFIVVGSVDYDVGRASESIGSIATVIIMMIRAGTHLTNVVVPFSS